MRTPTKITFEAVNLDQMATHTGRVAIFVDAEAALSAAADQANTLTQGAVARVAGSAQFAKLPAGKATVVNMPVGMAAEALDIVCLPAGARRRCQLGQSSQRRQLADCNGRSDACVRHRFWFGHARLHVRGSQNQS